LTFEGLFIIFLKEIKRLPLPGKPREPNEMCNELKSQPPPFLIPQNFSLKGEVYE